MFWFNAASLRCGTRVASEKRFRRTSEAFLHAPTPAIDTLEDRRLLSGSIGASNLSGPALVAGAVGNYEDLMNGTVYEKDTQRVIGPTTYAGQNVVETEATGLQPDSSTIITSYSFDSLTSAGLLVYGSMGSKYTPLEETSYTTATTYSPPEVILPGRMVAGKLYTETTHSVEEVTGSIAVSMIVTQQTTVLTLESAKHSVTVPAGKFKAYVVDESDTTTTTTTTTVKGYAPITNTSGPITTTEKKYYAPNAGLVEVAGEDGGLTELVSFYPKGPGILSGKLTGALPKTSLVAGHAANIRQKLTITDSGKGPLKEAVAVSYFLSTGTSVDNSSIPLPGAFHSPRQSHSLAPRRL